MLGRRGCWGSLVLHGAQQKRVDLMLGVDMALLAGKGKVTCIALFTGDSATIAAVGRDGDRLRHVWSPHLIDLVGDDRSVLHGGREFLGHAFELIGRPGADMTAGLRRVDPKL